MKAIIMLTIMVLAMAYGVVAPPVPIQCSNGASLIAYNPEVTIAVCDDPQDLTCEQNYETLCPVNWHLCSPSEYNSGNDNWQGIIQNWHFGEITCRDGYGAGHYTLWDLGTSYSIDVPYNQYAGSSLPQCPSDYGCNEQQYYALCCYGEGNNEIPPGDGEVPEFTLIGASLIALGGIGYAIMRRKKN